MCNVMSGDITLRRFIFLRSTCSLPFSLSPPLYFKANGHLRKRDLTRIENALFRSFSRENSHVLSDKPAWVAARLRRRRCSYVGPRGVRTREVEEPHFGFVWYHTHHTHGDAGFGFRSVAPRLIGGSSRKREIEHRSCLGCARPTPVYRYSVQLIDV